VKFVAVFIPTARTTFTHQPPIARERCDIPPEGWVCTRVKGHEGPCAATQATVTTLTINAADACALGHALMSSWPDEGGTSSFVFDDGSRFELVGIAGGAAPEGTFSTVTCEHTAPDGTVTVMHYQRIHERPEGTE
jgi:hypothetical protein